MTTEFDKFKEALEALCHQYGFQLAASGYGGEIEVWDLPSGEEPIYGDLKDATS